MESCRREHACPIVVVLMDDTPESPNVMEDGWEEAERWRVVGETLPDLYTAHIYESKIVSTSIGQRVAELLGYEVEELESDLGLRFQIIHHSDRDRVRSAFDHLLAGEPLSEVYRIYRRDGQMRCVRETAVAAKNPQGDVDRIIGLISDAGPERPASDHEPPEETLRKRARQLEILIRAAREINSVLEIPAVMRTLVTSGMELVGATAGAAGLRVDGEVVFEEYNNNGELIAINLTFELGVGVPGCVLETQHSYITNDAANDPHVIKEIQAELGFYNLIDVPIIGRDGRFLGCFELHNKEEHAPFTDEDVTMLEGLAAVASVALQNARTIARHKQAEDALRESEEKYRTLLENVDATIFRVDSQFRPIMIAGQAERTAGCAISDLLNQPELWMEMVHPEDRETERARYAQMAATGEPTTGVLRIVRGSGDIRWVRAHVSPRLDADGNLLHFDGVALDITDQIEAQQHEARHTEHMTVLAEISQAFVSSLDIGSILDSATQMTSDVLECACSIFFIEPATGRMHHSKVHSSEEDWSAQVDQALEQAGLTVENTIMDREIKPQIIPDATNDQSTQLMDFGRRAGIVPIIAAPIFVEGELFGIIAGGRRKRAPVFDDEDLWFLTEVASHASAALTNSALYRRQAKIAETLQRSFIPVSAQVRGLEIATCYYPAVGDVEVGGDFFDVIDFHNGTVGVVVADVSGKGMEAAMHTAEAKYMLRGFALQSSSPGFVVSALNQALWVYMGEFTFVTLVYALIDIGSGRMTYVNAGHEPPLIICPNGRELCELVPSGPVLGIVENQTYAERTFDLSHNDLLFCYTDGVTDVPCDGERFGYQRLVETVANAPVTRPHDLMVRIIDTIRDFGHGKQPDDQVIVVVRLES